MKILCLMLALFLYSPSSFAKAGNANDSLKDLLERFVPEYKTLAVAELKLSYVENFQAIQDLKGISRQSEFFIRYLNELNRIPRQSLSPEFKCQYDWLLYQIKLDRDRLVLEKDYRKHAPPLIPQGGIYKISNGKSWYEYYIRKWAGEVTPQDLERFGREEVTRVRSEMLRIQKVLGYEGKTPEFYQYLNGPSFWITDEEELKNRFREFREVILKNLDRAFEKTNIPLVDIQPISHPDKNTPPGIYSGGVFYYNFYQQKFGLRSIDWLFLHEAVPGHHYQTSVAPVESPLPKLFWYPGFTEGWAAYVEDIGSGMGAYQNPYAAYGKWEWDLVRSARVVMDVGINYRGWSKAEAREFWRKNIPNQDGIAEREIDRMFRWPGQVLAYKVGEREFLTLRKQFETFSRTQEEIRKFHTLVLERGSIPLSVLDKLVREASY